GTWNVSSVFSYRDGVANVSSSPGASMYFSFTGTGFSIGTSTSPFSGEMEICYDDDPVFDQASETNGNESCFVYQNEAIFTSYNISRTIVGLPSGTYYVRVRDLEDGASTTGFTLNQPRNTFYANSQVVVDYVEIYDDTTTPSIGAGFYNEDATDTSGNQYLNLYPQDRWITVDNFLAASYTGQSYTTVNNGFGGSATNVSGPTAMVSVDVPADGATVVMYLGQQTFLAPKQFLICAGTDRDGGIVPIEVIQFGFPRPGLGLSSPDGSCVLRDASLGTAVTVGPEDLTALSVAGNDVPVTFTALTPSQFLIDGFQIIGGDALTAGVYDDILPDTLLDFNSAGSDQVGSGGFACDTTQLWCDYKIFGAFGGQTYRTRNTGATLEFDIDGTGFSVLTRANFSGAQMRICYMRTPVTGEPNFPARNDTLSGGQFAWDNSQQDIELGGTWCDLVTTSTNTLSWNTYNAGRINPFNASQYGFSYYGLPRGEYSVQVMMFEQATQFTFNMLEIDAIAVFDDYNNLDVMSSTDTTPAAGVLTDGYYPETSAPISIEPLTAWSTENSFSPIPFGARDQSQLFTRNAGAIAQMRVDGNAVTLFQQQAFTGSQDISVCLLVTGATIHCTDESSTSATGVQNATNTAPWALAVETATFSQYAFTQTYFAPITFYGLGVSTPDLPHVLIFENRQHNSRFTIDGVLVRD
ncbi:MAG: hypothetical protein AAFR67_05320, partial [Chloroflexota bacterium]